jgi:hypothetical protein
MLRYKAVGDPEVKAEILANLMKAVAAAAARCDTPERQRGMHAKPWLFRRGETAPGRAA